MDFTIIVTGILVGIAFSAPVGPVNALCVRTALTGGFAAGLPIGLGGVLGDGVFAAIAAFGVTAVLDTIGPHMSRVQTVGGALVALVGLGMLFRPPRLRTLDAAEMRPAIGAYAGLASGFVLTITNPAPLLGFVALFGGLGEAVVEPGEFGEASLLVLGVLIGGSLWYGFVVSMVSLARARLDEKWFRMVNALAGTGLMIFGLVLVFGALTGRL